MKHAVILAHPKPASFNASIARTCVETLVGLGEEVLLRDLYALDFDPRLKAGELPAKGFAPAPDIVAEREKLSEVQSFIFVYPFWFNAPPAILKGYVDRVFSMGFGYAPASGGTEGLLSGKTLLSFSTSGATDEWVNQTGALKALMQVFDLHLSGVCGLSMLDHLHLGGVPANMVEEAGQALLDQVRERLTKAFAVLSD